MKTKLLLNVSVILASTLAAAVCDYNNSPSCPTHHASCGIFDTHVSTTPAPALCHTTMDMCCECVRSLWTCQRPNNGGAYSGPDQDETAPSTTQNAHCDV